VLLGVFVNNQISILEGSNLLQILVNLELYPIIPPLDSPDDLLHLHLFISLLSLHLPLFYAVINGLLFPLEREHVEYSIGGVEVLLQAGYEQAQIGQARN
jgi:hypothetical protein